MTKYENKYKVARSACQARIAAVSDGKHATVLYKERRRLKELDAVADLLQQLPDAAYDTLTEQTKLTLETMFAVQKPGEYTAAVQVQFNEGDRIVDILKKYSSTRDLMKKMTAYCEKNGLAMDYNNGVIVRGGK